MYILSKENIKINNMLDVIYFYSLREVGPVKCEQSKQKKNTRKI